MKSLYQWVDSDAHRIIIKDIGHDSGYRSVTNDIENIVRDLHKRGLLRNRRLFYYDSDDRITEVLHLNGEFVNFEG